MTKFTKDMQDKSLKSFSKAILKIKTEKEAAAFFEEILTPPELKKLSLRWRLMEMLSAGHSQRSTANELGISLCKITRGAKILNKPKSLTKTYIKERDNYDKHKFSSK